MAVSIMRDVREAPCDCSTGDCGWAHHELTGDVTVEITVEAEAD